MDRVYIAIDLKSFYASVECRERGLDPLRTNLVVADASRTDKTICLAVSPPLKARGISGRPRLFEVIQGVAQINTDRKIQNQRKAFTGESYDDLELKADPSLKVSYITAPPRMAKYIEYSTNIYHIYLKYVAEEDIHVYSIDEVFMDVTNYLNTYKMTPHQLAMTMIQDVLRETGITATAGIGTNLYLAKIAMDIVAKHIPADEDGVRIAELDEQSYRRQLWTHQPLTDFWRIGGGYARKLIAHGIYTMGDVAQCSLYQEDLLYKLFGINAELLIDHAWGYESCTIAKIKAYRPKASSLGSGQVLMKPYDFHQARLIVAEMVDNLTLELVEKGLVTNQVVLHVGYDRANLDDAQRRKEYHGPVSKDFYGRLVPKSAHGSENIWHHTSSSRQIIGAALKLYDRIVDPMLLVRRISVTCTHVKLEAQIKEEKVTYEQLDLFTDYAALQKQRAAQKDEEEREKKMQQAALAIKKKFGKNAILKGMNFQKGSTMRERNNQIGGHKA